MLIKSFINIKQFNNSSKYALLKEKKNLIFKSYNQYIAERDRI